MPMMCIGQIIEWSAGGNNDASRPWSRPLIVIVQHGLTRSASRFTPR